MKTNKPTVRLEVARDTIQIKVTWKGTRASESTGVKSSVPKPNKQIYKRLGEIDERIEDLLKERKPFTASDCLSRTTRKTNPQKVLVEMASVKKLEEGTVDSYRIALSSLKKYFGEDFTLDELSLHQIQGYARITKVNPTTMCGYLKRLHTLLQFAYEKGYLSENVMSSWKFKADGYKHKDKPKSVGRGEITKLISFFEKGDESAGVWLGGFYFNGLALTDLMSVDWRGLEKSFIDGNWYWSFTVNRKKTREVAHVVTPVFPLTEKIYAFLSTEPWKGYNVRQYTSRINRLLKKIDPSLTYYQCRHTFCSMMVASGSPLNTISSMMGRSVNGISTYVMRVTETESLARVASSLKKTELLETPPEDLFE